MVMIDKKEVGSKSSSTKKSGPKNPEYRGTASVKKNSASKTVATPGTKVSQGTIDKIKKMGMAAALKSAPNASAEMQEGLRRMYGASRVKSAMGSSTSSAQKNTPEKGAGFKRVSPYPYSGVKVKGSGRPAGAPGAISGASRNTAPSAISGKKVSTTSSTKAAPTKRQSDAEKLVGGVKRVINSSPGANIRKSVTSSKTTSASTTDRRKAAAAAVKRAGGRSM
jgi:hypothetical protein